MPETGVARFRDSFERGDAEAAADTFAREFAFYHPLDAQPTTDRDLLIALLGAARDLMGDDFRFVDHLTGSDHEALLWSSRIGGHAAEGIDLIRVNEAGELVEARIIARPVAALQAWSDGMRERLGGTGPHTVER